ncbi:MAG: imidazolonepropionase [Cyclonatronaceae bacterium]
MPVLKNISVLYTCPPGGGQSDVGEIRNAAMVWADGQIIWTGPEADLPSSYSGYLIQDARGRMVIPGLIDCHTHLAFGGWRADEFEMRSLGQTYLDIAKAGGGILSSVSSTRELPPDKLLAKCRILLSDIIRLGVTTIEAKTGYGLNVDTELAVLRVYRQLNNLGPVDVIPTYLGAHAIPPEFSDDRRKYIRAIINTIIPMVQIDGAARFIDVFVEDSAFTADEARRILGAGQEYGLRAKIHADQLSACGGAELAAEVGAVSADHLEMITDQGIQRLSKAGVVAVSLPLASFYLRQPALPARKLINSGVPVAVATDFNPGSAPSWHLPLAMTMACTMQSMSPAEVLKGATIYAARALSADDTIGSLMPGKQADFAIIDAPDVNHWLYHFRPNACVTTCKKGLYVYDISEKAPVYPWY